MILVLKVESCLPRIMDAAALSRYDQALVTEYNNQLPRIRTQGVLQRKSQEVMAFKYVNGCISTWA